MEGFILKDSGKCGKGLSGEAAETQLRREACLGFPGTQDRFINGCRLSGPEAFAHDVRQAESLTCSQGLELSVAVHRDGGRQRMRLRGGRACHLRGGEGREPRKLPK